MGTIQTFLFEGFISGLAAGILMGLTSHTGFRVGAFQSSLFLIDGSFALRILGKEYDEMRAVRAGIPVHFMTSISFGITYTVLTNLLKVKPTNLWTIVSYVFLLWLSMLLVALPVAGHGILGKKLGTNTWFEQFILHVVFGIGLLGTLHFLQ